MRLLTLLLGLGILAGMVAPASADIVPPMERTEADARETVLAFLENFNDGNVEGIASTYSDQPGFTWIEQGHVAYASKAEAIAGVTKALQMMKGARMETGPGFRLISIADRSYLAIVPTTIYMAGADGKEAELGKSLTTMTLIEESGGWRILVGHTAADPAP
jgi:ketosteroid isomerase-like protein